VFSISNRDVPFSNAELEHMHKAFILLITKLEKSMIDGNQHQVDLLNQKLEVMTPDVTAAIRLIESLTPQEPVGYDRTALKLICSFYHDSEDQDEHMDSENGRHCVRGTYFELPREWNPLLVPSEVSPTMFKGLCVENTGLQNLSQETMDFLLRTRWKDLKNVGPTKVELGASLMFRGSTIHYGPAFRSTKDGFFRVVIFEYFQPAGQRAEHTTEGEYQIFEYFPHMMRHPNLFYANVRRGHPFYEQVMRHPSYEWLPPDGGLLYARRWNEICKKKMARQRGSVLFAFCDHLQEGS
jgi:hypothetical protein